MDFALKSLGAGLSPSITEYRDPDQVKYRQGHSFRVHMAKKQSQVRKKLMATFDFILSNLAIRMFFMSKALNLGTMIIS